MLRHSLTTRLVLSHLLATTTALVVLSAIVLVLLARNLRAETLARLDNQATVYAAYAADLAPTSTLLRALAGTIVGRFPGDPDIAVRIFASDGTLLTSDAGIGPYPSAATRPYMTGQLLQLSIAPTNRRYVARPITRGAQIVGVVEVSRSIAAEQQPIRDLLVLLLPGAAFALLIATALALALARGLLRPLRLLREVAQRIAAGDLQARSGAHTTDEIGALAATLDGMADELGQRFEDIKRLAQSRRESYRSVSHDVRTPLTAIRGLAENLEDTATPEQERSLRVLQSETARLQRLVEEMLAGGDTFNPMRRLRTVDLAALVETTVDLMRPRAERNGVLLRSAIVPATMQGDADRLRQALVNVLDNALKWTPTGGTIDVRLEESPDTIALIVADNGPGIPDDLRETVWERGVRGEGGGQGLGLSLVRDVATAHGGSVDLGSGPGTTLTMRLPRRR